MTITFKVILSTRAEYDQNRDISKFPFTGRCTYSNELSVAFKEKLDIILNDNVTITYNKKTFDDIFDIVLDTTLSISEVQTLLATDFEVVWDEFEKFQSRYRMDLEAVAIN